MKKFILFFMFLFLSCFLVGCTSNNTITNTLIENTVSNATTQNNIGSKESSEELLYSFSTNILDKDSNRQINIELTCSVLNGTIVKAGETFSFCDVVGKATPERGYKKAKIYDSEGNIIVGYGGGNCQVSSTLYNAVLQDYNFEIIERHPHSHTVYYVEPDKDAAVACGSVDFKFKNNNNFDVKIEATTDGEQVTINIIRI